MYNQDYEEYMRSVLGYNIPYKDSTYNMYMDDYNMTRQISDDINLEELYPEIYKIIYPIVCKNCANVPDKITDEVIENMVNDIYINVEPQINIGNNIQAGTRSVDSKNANSKDVKKEEKRDQNFILRDLIKILILKELLQNQRPNRPRPPYMPGRPPMPRSIYEQRFLGNEYLY